jgi:hypothetical protein
VIHRKATIWSLDVVHHHPSDDLLGRPEIRIDMVEHEVVDPHCKPNRAVCHSHSKLQRASAKCCGRPHILTQIALVPICGSFPLESFFPQQIVPDPSHLEVLERNLIGWKPLSLGIRLHISQCKPSKIASLNHILWIVTLLRHQVVKGLTGLAKS